MSNHFSSGLEYRAIADGMLLLCGIGTCTDEDIVVPESLNSSVVVGVDDSAFIRSNHIKSVILPESVSYIGGSAFAWCRNLTYVKACGAVEISERAFMGCDSLSSVELGDKLEILSAKALAYCSSLQSVSLPDSTYSLGASVFEGCRNIVSIRLPDTLRIIQSGSFYACTSLININAPSSLEYIDEFAFAYCDAIKSFDLPRTALVNKDAFHGCVGHHRNILAS